LSSRLNRDHRFTADRLNPYVSSREVCREYDKYNGDRTKVRGQKIASEREAVDGCSLRFLPLRGVMSHSDLIHHRSRVCLASSCTILYRRDNASLD